MVSSSNRLLLDQAVTPVRDSRARRRGGAGDAERVGMVVMVKALAVPPALAGGGAALPRRYQQQGWVTSGWHSNKYQNSSQCQAFTGLSWYVARASGAPCRVQHRGLGTKPRCNPSLLLLGTSAYACAHSPRESGT